MLQWQQHFSNSILARGREYFRAGRVRDLEKIDSTYFADVCGTYRYHVIITLSGDRVSNMECSCPCAEHGERCKHMAAVLYAIQAELSPVARMAAVDRKQPQAEQTRKKVSPFYRPQEGEYRYFDLSRILSHYTIYEDTYQKAQRLLAAGISGFTPQTGYLSGSGNRGMVCSVSVTFKGARNSRECTATIDRNGIVSNTCGCPGCGAYYFGFLRTDSNERELCEHSTALFLLMDEYLKTHDDGDTTDYDAVRMIRSFRRKTEANLRSQDVSTENSPEETKEIRLEPRLTKTFDGLELSFRIGTDKLYVVRNMTELVNAVENGERLELGKLCTLDFAAAVFVGENRKYYKLMRSLVRDEQYRQEYSADDTGTALKAETILFGSSLDRFFEIAENHDTAFVNKTDNGPESGTVRMEDGEPEIVFTVSQDVDRTGTFQGVIFSGEFPEFFDGVSHKYFFHDNRLLRVKAEKLAWLEDVADMFSRSSRVHIGRNMLTEFYHDVLPELRRYARVKEPDLEEVDDYLPPEVIFSFYLDSENGVPVCKALATYDDRDYNLVCWTGEHLKSDRMRDTVREIAVTRALMAYFPQVALKTEEFSAADGDSAMYRAVTEGVDELRRYGAVYCTNRFNALSVRRKVSIRVGVSVESDIMNLNISSDLSTEELRELLQSYRLRKKYHRLKTGEFIALDENVAELSDMMEELHVSLKDFVSGKTEIPAYRALYLDKMLEGLTDIYATRDKTYRNLIKEFKTVSESEFDAPESIAGVLRPYQLYGYKWLRVISKSGFGGILADDMGLGKTVQVIALLLAEKEEGAIGTSLIVCPASLVYNWNAELARFAPELKVGVISGTKSEREEMLSHYARYDVLVTSYDLLKRDCIAYEGKVFLYHVIDEAQYIKNSSTGAAKSVKVIRSKHRFALTGTPIENRLSELWSIFDFLMPGLLYGYEEFRSELELPIIKKKDEAASARLRRMVSPFILRRLKGDVLKDLPEKIEQTQYIRLEDEQQLLYNAQVAHMRSMIESKTDAEYNTGKIQLLAELTKIREICCDPSLIFDEYAGGSAKRQACMELLTAAMDSGHRVLLFSQFTSMLALLEKDLQQQKIDYYIITGETPKKERIELVNDFNEGTTPVFLISLKAGGTGLNLTGADVVIHYDPWWNIAAQNQATDRAHRIGQTKIVTVYQLIAENSVEENIRKMQIAKKDLADEILSGEGTNFSSISREELLELLG